MYTVSIDDSTEQKSNKKLGVLRRLLSIVSVLTIPLSYIESIIGGKCIAEEVPVGGIYALNFDEYNECWKFLEVTDQTRNQDISPDVGIYFAKWPATRVALGRNIFSRNLSICSLESNSYSKRPIPIIEDIVPVDVKANVFLRILFDAIMRRVSKVDFAEHEDKFQSPADITCDQSNAQYRKVVSSCFKSRSQYQYRFFQNLRRSCSRVCCPYSLVYVAN